MMSNKGKKMADSGNGGKSNGQLVAWFRFGLTVAVLLAAFAGTWASVRGDVQRNTDTIIKLEAYQSGMQEKLHEMDKKLERITTILEGIESRATHEKAGGVK